MPDSKRKFVGKHKGDTHIHLTVVTPVLHAAESYGATSGQTSSTPDPEVGEGPEPSERAERLPIKVKQRPSKKTARNHKGY